jgi:Carbonic anhydrase
MRARPSFEQIYRLANISNSARPSDPSCVRVSVAKDELHWNSTARVIRHTSAIVGSARSRVPSPITRERSSQSSHLEPNHSHLFSRGPHRAHFTTSSHYAQMPNIPALQGFFDNNGKWADAVSQHDSEFFQQSAEGQKPKILWIGCADSRVPESVIMACKPGEVFVHRNIAK